MYLYRTYEWYLWFESYKWEIYRLKGLQSLQAMKPKTKSNFIWFRIPCTSTVSYYIRSFRHLLNFDMAENRHCVNVYLREEFSRETEWTVVRCWVNVPWVDLSRNISGWEGSLVCQLTDPRVIFLPWMGKMTKRVVCRETKGKRIVLKLVIQTFVFWCPIARRLMPEISEEFLKVFHNNNK